MQKLSQAVAPTNNNYYNKVGARTEAWNTAEATSGARHRTRYGARHGPEIA